MDAMNNIPDDEPLNSHVEALLDSGIWHSIVGEHLVDNYLRQTPKRRVGFLPGKKNKPRVPLRSQSSPDDNRDRLHSLWVLANAAWDELVEEPGNVVNQKAFIAARDAFNALQDTIDDAVLQRKSKGTQEETRQGLIAAALLPPPCPESVDSPGDT